MSSPKSSSSNKKTSFGKETKDSDDTEDDDLDEKSPDIIPTQSEINLFWKDKNLVKNTESTSSMSNPPSCERTLTIPEKGDEKSRYPEVLPCSSCEFPDPFEIAKKRGCFDFLTRSKIGETFSELWLISVPGEDKTLDVLNSETRRSSLSINYKFHIPKLKIGTLDDLLSLIEQLITLDKYVREVTIKLFEMIRKGLEENRDMLEKNLLVNNIKPILFLTRFAWNSAKYPTWHRISRIADNIFSHVDKINNTLKEKSIRYEGLRKNLKRHEERKENNLEFIYLGNIVKEEDLVQDSNYLTTLLVVVPKSKEKRWLHCYESLCDMVIPQSSKKLFEQNSQCLYNVTLWKKNADLFKVNALKNSFVIRNFDSSKDINKEEDNNIDDLIKLKALHLATIFRWAKINFSETFEAWIHVKALRVFVESVLRYGLPVNFQAILILPLKSKRKLRKVLNKLYSKVDIAPTGIVDEIPGCLTVYEVEEYYRYVFLKVNVDFIASIIE